MTNTDIIVFSQDELDAAIKNGKTSICLCDNEFLLPNVSNIRYTAVGKVTASVDSAKTDIVCENFSPKVIHKITNVKNKAVGAASRSVSGSYASSYRSSYRYSFSGSFQTSYTLSGSFRTSYTLSGSFKTSYRLSGSFRTSYFLSGSFKTSYKNSTCFKNSFCKKQYLIDEYINVNGYGIHLI